MITELKGVEEQLILLGNVVMSLKERCNTLEFENRELKKKLDNFYKALEDAKKLNG